MGSEERLDGIRELEIGVAQAILAGQFKEFIWEETGSRIALGARDRQALWTAVSNALTSALYGAAGELYGSNENFQRHGVLGLTTGEALEANRKAYDTVKLLRTGFDTLRGYRPSGD